jgi:3-oxoacyl-(acyl-carrier-protein) synthase
LRSALHEIKLDLVDHVFVIGAVYDFSAVDLQSLALMGGITSESFNGTPELASRPFDIKREGFVPAHGAGGIFLSVDQTKAPYAELIDVAVSSDRNHMPNPSQKGQMRALELLFKRNPISKEQIQYINAHATSTPRGDLVESASLSEFFGPHHEKLFVNATKSMIGHTCWSSAILETVAAILQIKGKELHSNANLEQLDPEIKLNVLRENQKVDGIEYMLKNSFGFGGINSVSMIRNMS